MSEPQAVREDRFQIGTDLLAIAASRLLPWLRVTRYRRQFTYER